MRIQKEQIIWSIAGGVIFYFGSIIVSSFIVMISILLNIAIPGDLLAIFMRIIFVPFGATVSLFLLEKKVYQDTINKLLLNLLAGLIVGGVPFTLLFFFLLFTYNFYVPMWLYIVIVPIITLFGYKLNLFKQ